MSLCGMCGQPLSPDHKCGSYSSTPAELPSSFEKTIDELERSEWLHQTYHHGVHGDKEFEESVGECLICGGLDIPFPPIAYKIWEQKKKGLHDQL